MGDKQVALIRGQTGSPYWETNRQSLLGDKQVALIGEHTVLIRGQTGEPVHNKIANRFPLGGQIGCPFGGQTGCSYWGTNMITFLGNKQAVRSYWGTKRLPLLGTSRQSLLGGKQDVLFSGFPLEEGRGINRLPLLGDK